MVSKGKIRHKWFKIPNLIEVLIKGILMVIHINLLNQIINLLICIKYPKCNSKNYICGESIMDI